MGSPRPFGREVAKAEVCNYGLRRMFFSRAPEAASDPLGILPDFAYLSASAIGAVAIYMTLRLRFRTRTMFLLIVPDLSGRPIRRFKANGCSFPQRSLRLA
jgi:hypothetical protein